MAVNFALVFFIVLYSNVNGDNTHNWYYPEDGVERWGGNCDGIKQSPIDISEFDLDFAKGVQFKLMNFNKVVKFQAENVGHTVLLKVPSSEKIYLAGGNTKGKFILQQIHFHWGSEHTINSKRYPLELHLVHVAEQYLGNKLENIKDSNGIHVLGVLFYENKNSNMLLDRFFTSLKDLSKVGSKTNLEISPRDLIPMNVNEFYRYQGSLTTPMCNEIVQWTIFKSRIPLSTKQYEIVKGLETLNGTMSFNFRSTKPLNNRNVTFIYAKAFQSRCSAAIEIIIFCSYLVYLNN